ncbi:MAG: hypothetical protein OEM01_09195 [Desulfobulbaceae bacterium]|nr:hypothetical protein [Desulfobulbaceae bacterium]
MKGAGLKSSLHLAKDNISLDKGKEKKRVTRSRLINYLNRINFRDGDITLHFRHKKYGHIIFLQAMPQICNDNYLRCLWSEYADAEKKLKHFAFIHFSFTDGLKHFYVESKLLELTRTGVYLELPEACHEKKAREIKRHQCQGVTAQISQNSRILQGFLESFSAQSLGVRFLPATTHSEQKFDENLPANVVLCRGSDYIYSGNCDIIRQNKSPKGNYLVLKPIKENIRIFKPKEVRSERLQLSPNPNIIFNHPITEKKISLGLIDISGTGFSVAEDEDNALLMPGMICPELEIEFIHGFRVKCNTQVVYRNHAEDHVKCGIAILDMAVQDHLRLSSFLHQAKNRHSYISTTNIDLDALWDFFFESGFVYPEKYAHIIEQKKSFYDLYKKLYNENPEIFRHVMYQDRGKIYGHVSMFRYYQNTWLMHHHAAVKSPKHKAGLVVMEHILQYINECHTLASSKMKYIACYFRPNNRFASRVFGGAARALDDQKKCSLDDFAYFHFEPNEKHEKLAPEWTLGPSQDDDLLILNQWYSYRSGGLMLDGLDLTTDALIKDQQTSQEYAKADFKRLRKIYSLKNDDELMAMLVINKSDLGLNMSDLTNCIQVFVLEEKPVRENVLYAALNEFAEYYDQEEIPVLLYPTTYAEIHSVRFEKVYELTVLNLDFISPYLQFMQSLTSQKKRKIKDHAII